jgi:hypothetical protein
MSIEVKHPNGYNEKIDFWQTKYYIALGKGVCAYNDGDIELGKECNEEAHYCMSKLSYFTKRQKDVYGK